MKILIVEDNSQRIKKFKRECIGHILHIAKTAKDAISILQDHTFDLIFLDHDLNNQEMVQSDNDTGYAVAQAINQDQKHKQSIIVIHSCNPFGAANILKIFDKLNKQIFIKPFISLNIKEIIEYIQEKIGSQ